MKEVSRILRQASDLLGSISERDRQGLAVGIVGERARSGDLDGALAEAQLLQRPEAKKQALGCIANAMDYAGNLPGALSVIGTLGEQERGSLYATLAGFHASRGDLEGALWISRLIQRDPNDLMHSLVQIAKQESQSGDQASAKSTLDRALSIAEAARKEDPNLATLFVGIALTQFEIGETSGAAATLSHYSDIVHHASDPGWKANFLPAIAITFAEIGDTGGVLRAVDELPPGTTRDGPLALIAGELAERGNLTEAFKSVSRISEAQTRAAGFQRIADVQGRSGNTAGAVETISMIPDPAGRAAALAALALAQAQKGRCGSREYRAPRLGSCR
jgi:lipopolysaccharide biosynthesis regulator YciM